MRVVVKDADNLHFRRCASDPHIPLGRSIPWGVFVPKLNPRAYLHPRLGRGCDQVIGGAELANRHRTVWINRNVIEIRIGDADGALLSAWVDRRDSKKFLFAFNPIPACYCCRGVERDWWRTDEHVRRAPGLVSRPHERQPVRHIKVRIVIKCIHHLNGGRGAGDLHDTVGVPRPRRIPLFKVWVDHPRAKPYAGLSWCRYHMVRRADLADRHRLAWVDLDVVEVRIGDIGYSRLRDALARQDIQNLVFTPRPAPFFLRAGRVNRNWRRANDDVRCTISTKGVFGLCVSKPERNIKMRVMVEDADNLHLRRCASDLHIPLGCPIPGRVFVSKLNPRAKLHAGLGWCRYHMVRRADFADRHRLVAGFDGVVVRIAYSHRPLLRDACGRQDCQLSRFVVRPFCFFLVPH